MSEPMTPEQQRRENYAAALAPVLKAFIKRPYVTGARGDLADAALSMADAEQTALLAELRRHQERIAELEQAQTTDRAKYRAGLSRADQHVNAMNEEMKRYAAGDELPVAWSVYNAMHLRAANAEASVARLEAEASRHASSAHHWRTRYYAESRTYWDAELPPGGECCADCGQPVESEPCPGHHPATVAERLRARIAELEARPSRAEVLRDAETAVTEDDLGPRGGMTEDYENGWWNSRHAAAERVRRLADAAEASAGRAPCGPAPSECDAETGEPCTTHEREQAHAEGEHTFCGPDCVVEAGEGR